MIRFDNWTIQADGEVIARQFDNLTRTLTVAGDIPAGWEWAVLVQVGNAMDIIPLTAAEGALSIVLTAQQLSIAGYYQMQLRGTQGDLVRHTNMVTVYIPASLSGDEQWPTVPSEFSDLERRVNEKAKEAADNAGQSANNAAASEQTAKESADSAAEFEENARVSAENAGASEQAAAEHKTAAETAEAGAKEAEQGALASAERAEEAAAKEGAYAAQAGEFAREAGAANTQAQQAAANASQSANNATESEQAAADHRAAAEEAEATAKGYTENPPIIGDNGNWWTWDGVQYIDSGRVATGELTRTQGNTLYANALKGTASGAIVRVDDVSPLEHDVKVRVTGFDNPASVTVKAHGKNLIPYPYVGELTASQNGITFTYNDDGTIGVKGAASQYTMTYLIGTGKNIDALSPYLKDGATYTVSVKRVSGSSPLPDFIITLSDKATGKASYVGKSNPTFTVDKTKYTYEYLRLFVGVDLLNVELDCVVSVQLEMGTTATEHEAYRCAEYTTNEDGTCGVTSVAPTMTLTTDTDGVVMDCEYNRDINKAFEQLQQAIISMGGNV